MIGIMLFSLRYISLFSTFSFYFMLRSSLKKKGKVICIERTMGLNTYIFIEEFNITRTLYSPSIGKPFKTVS